VSRSLDNIFTILSKRKTIFEVNYLLKSLPANFQFKPFFSHLSLYPLDFTFASSLLTFVRYLPILIAQTYSHYFNIFNAHRRSFIFIINLTLYSNFKQLQIFIQTLFTTFFNYHFYSSFLFKPNVKPLPLQNTYYSTLLNNYLSL
jgi:hypothetical protein